MSEVIKELHRAAKEYLAVESVDPDSELATELREAIRAYEEDATYHEPVKAATRTHRWRALGETK